MTRSEPDWSKPPLCIRHSPPSAQQAMRASGVVAQPAQTAAFPATRPRHTTIADNRCIKPTGSRMLDHRREVKRAQNRQSSYESRYTRSVNWRHRIAAVLLAVLAGLPVSGTVCAFACGWPSSAASAHHGSGQKCEEPAQPSSGPQISGTSEHECRTHDAAVRQATTTAAERADLTAKSVPLMIGVIQTKSVSLRDPQAFLVYGSPPGTAPPTTTPLVLRV